MRSNRWTVTAYSADVWFSDAVIIVLKIILRKRKDARIREYSMKIFRFILWQNEKLAG